MAVSALLSLSLGAVTSQGSATASTRTAVVAAEHVGALGSQAADLEPVLTPAMLAYAQHGRVWWVAADGRPRMLATEGYAAEAALAPDGRWLAYLLTPDSALEQAPLPAQLWLADLAAGAAQLIADDLSWRSQLVWSPRGARLALIEQGQLAVYDLAGGAREIAAHALAHDGLAFAGYAWLPDGGGLVCLTQDDGGRQWVELTADDGGLSSPVARVAVPDGLRATSVALSPGGQAATLLLASGALAELWLDGGSLAPLSTAGEPVTAFAWSSVGARLALASSDGLLWLAVRGASGLTFDAPLAQLTAPATHLSWNDAGQVQVSLASRGGLAAALLTPETGALRTAGLSPQVAARTAPPQLPLDALVSAPFDWYRYQGSSDSGVCASTNCGPTTVAMAIEFARNDLYVPISTIRTYMTGDAPCGSGTNGDQLRAALTNWSVPFTRINGFSAVRDAINLRGHIVIVPVIMSAISPGVDYNTAYTSPANNHHRYYTFTGGHWVVVRGISADGQWVQVYDPNVWLDGRYYYSDNTFKGRDRLYSASEFNTAFINNGNWAIEIMATPAATPTATPTAVPTPTPTPTPVPSPTPTSVPQPPVSVQATMGLYADRVVIVWAAPAGATFYAVRRSAAPTGASDLIGLPARASWEDYDTAPGASGYYWVAACNTNGCSDYAGPASGYRASSQAAQSDLPPRVWLPFALTPR